MSNDDFDLDDLLDAARRASGLDEQLREGRIVAGTAGSVLRDSLQADVQAGHDVVEGQVRAGHDVLNGLGQAGTDYTGGWSRAAEDAAHGNVLAVPVDLLSGQVKATAHLAEAGLTGMEDVAAADLKAAGHLVEGGEHVAHDVLSGGKHLLGIGGDDKAAVLKKVGSEGGGLLAANEAELKRGRARLQDIKRRLAAKDPHAFATADQILDPGSAGLHFFDYFLPAYDAWTGAGVSIETIRQAYDRERGMSFAALAADGASMTATGAGVTKITNALQQAYDALVPTWQGQAASQFETTMRAYFTADAAVASRFGDVGQGLTDVVGALQQLVYTKASTVSNLYAETLPPAVDGVQALRAMVGVARNEGVDDEYRRWVLGVLHQPMHGRHGWDDDTDQWSSDALDDRSRALAQQVAGQWCDEVLAQQVGQRLELFFELCDRTTQGVQQLFDTVTKNLGALSDPFAAMPLTQPSDGRPGGDATAPQGTAPGPAGAPGISGVPGAGPASGGSWVPPTGTVAGTPVTSTPVTSTPVTPTSGAGDPAPAPVTNPDGSVTFGEAGDLRITGENPDGSFDLVQTTDGVPHDYRLVFGPNGRPVLLAVDGQPPASAPPAAPDGSLPVGGVTVGPDDAGTGFPVSQGTDAQHSFHVSHDDTGHPHVTDASAGPGGGLATAAGSTPAAQAAVPSAVQSGVPSGGGTTYGALAADGGAAAMPAGSAGPADASPAAAAAGGHGGSMMPMMPMGGMGRGGGDQDLKRRYQPPREDVVDADDLDEWDRLGPTIG